jgi:membrane protein YqaA with SNARE-associated domain
MKSQTRRDSFFQRLSGTLHRFADKPWVPFALGFISLLDFFTLVIPSDAFFLAALLGDFKKWKRFAAGMIGGRLLAVGFVFFASRHLPLDWVHAQASTYGLSSAWDQCERFFESFGPMSLGVTALTPLPMFFVTLMSAVSGAVLWEIESFAFGGLLVRYLVLTAVVAGGQKILK